jgi:hypothetical protein
VLPMSVFALSAARSHVLATSVDGASRRPRPGTPRHERPRRHVGLDSVLSNRAPYASRLDELLSRDDVSGHDFVYGELLIGDKGGRKLHRRGIGRIDVHLLASALVARLELWTTDPAFATVAKELGISFE